tara:strand:- start:1085 stop:1963 length:879 start_codon:yes stop_codon:yes gene_type:complete
MKIFKKAISSLFKSKDKIRQTFSKIISFTQLSKEDKEQIEDCLLSSDVGWELTERIINNLETTKTENSWEKLLIETIKKSIKNIDKKADELQQIILIIGVNGSGKTTSAAKLAKYLKDNKKKVTLVAADTYRAAAVEQLGIWSERMNIDFISNPNTTDPASIAYDGANSGISNNHDHIIIDTAGRLHTSKNLMMELEKIYRVINKLTDKITVCISIDGNTGQNGINQVKEFNDYLPIDNIILNKMDGTAKGGIALAVIDKFFIPISFLGVGETYDDLLVFDLDEYLELLIKE